MNAYKELRDRQQQEFNTLPIKFAFGQQRFDQMMAEFGLSPDDTDKIYRFGDTGGYYLRTDSEKIRDMSARHAKERADAMAADTTGKGYINDMFRYELGNHEYCYTQDLTETLQALGLTKEDVERDARLKRGLRLAIKAQRDCF